MLIPCRSTLGSEQALFWQAHENGGFCPCNFWPPIKLTSPEICPIQPPEVRAVSSAGLEQGTSNSQVGGSSPPRLANHSCMLLQHNSARFGHKRANWLSRHLFRLAVP